jgi:hypothetical protein
VRDRVAERVEREAEQDGAAARADERSPGGTARDVHGDDHRGKHASSREEEPPHRPAA